MGAMAGCAQSPAVRREIALLKNEILDMQTQYFALKSEYIRATGQEPQLDFMIPYSTTPGQLPYDPACDDHYLGNRTHPESELPTRIAMNTVENQGQPIVGTHTFGTADDPGFRAPNRSTAAIPPSVLSDRHGQPAEVTYASLTENTPASVDVSRDVTPVELTVAAEQYWDDAESGRDPLPTLRVQVRYPHGAIAALPLQVSLLDIQRDAGQQRIGFWDLNAQQVGVLIERGGDPRTIDLLLPWPTDATADSIMEIFVRQRQGSHWISGSTQVQITGGH
ncbi:MAG TPA: hypothetical protein PKD54_00020 [Pirellulaceae bacterium]|nr:hypothetical protein [Pirellulaceae bacterium]